MPHPYIDNAFYFQNDFQKNGWIYYSNPYQVAQPTLNLPPSGPEAKNMGRRIKARGDLKISFTPTEHPLADQIVFHLDNKSKLWNVQIECTLHNGTKNKLGYLTIRNGENISVGYNCKLEHTYLSVPKITTGLTQIIKSKWSRQEQFSVVLKNSSGQYNLGFQNDRISKSPVTEIHWRNGILAEWNWTSKNWPTIVIYSTLAIALITWILSTMYTLASRRWGRTEQPPYTTLRKNVIPTKF